MGFCWCFALKWPTSIQSLFWRRCPLDQATVLAIFQERAFAGTPSAGHDAASVMGCPGVQKCMHQLWIFWNAFWSTVFSDVDGYQSRSGGGFAYVPVKRDDIHPDIRFVIFQLCRYNFESAHAGFLPASLRDEDLPSFVTPHQGLSSDAVQERLHQVGPNSFDMKRPLFINVLGEELIKPFYTYQLFMIWTWFPLYYFYMASE